MPENLPVNYQVLSGLPMVTAAAAIQAESRTATTTTTNAAAPESPRAEVNLTYCTTHPTKKIKFFCRNDQELFCSKCILKHTQQKHEVINCSPKIIDMKRMVQEMVNEVEVLETDTSANEELYSKLELKVCKKFNEEIDRLEKSFRRIMEQLDIQ